MAVLQWQLFLLSDVAIVEKEAKDLYLREEQAHLHVGEVTRAETGLDLQSLQL